MSLLKTIQSPQFLKPVLLTVHQQVTRRIFDEGKDSNGSQIGTYTEPYIKRRQRKGLGSSSKVVLEFTGQMRNDFGLIEEGNTLGSGFQNDFNAKKSVWVEETYNKPIFDLTKQEQDLLASLLDQAVQRLIDNGQT